MVTATRWPQRAPRPSPIAAARQAAHTASNNTTAHQPMLMNATWARGLSRRLASKNYLGRVERRLRWNWWGRQPERRD